MLSGRALREEIAAKRANETDHQKEVRISLSGGDNTVEEEAKKIEHLRWYYSHFRHVATFVRPEDTTELKEVAVERSIDARSIDEIRKFCISGHATVVRPFCSIASKLNEKGWQKIYDEVVSKFAVNGKEQKNFKELCRQYKLRTPSAILPVFIQNLFDEAKTAAPVFSSQRKM